MLLKMIICLEYLFDSFQYEYSILNLNQKPIHKNINSLTLLIFNKFVPTFWHMKINIFGFVTI